MDAQATIDQLGGINRIMAMVKARNFAKGDNYVQFQFSGNRKMNVVKIELTPSDEYELKFYKFARSQCKEVSTTQAWAGNLRDVFESETGLYLNL